MTPEQVSEWIKGNRRAVVATEINPIKIDHQFRFISATSLTCSPANWLIKNYIEEQTTASFFGAAGSMKTFITIDMGLCVSTGKEWHGNRVKQGPVLYICGEGKAGIAKRINAWGKNNGMKSPLFFVSTSAAQLLSVDSLDAVELAANEVASLHGTPVLIIIDTLNRNFGPGDENSTSDMTAFIQAIDQLKDRLQCAIIIVHHSGLGDAKRGRGSSALRGAMDFEYNCDKSGDTIEEQVVTLTNTKTKDHEAPAPKSFKPIIVDLGHIDEDMKPITSLALEQTEGPTRKAAKLSGANLIALDALKAITHESGEATEDSWRQEAYSRGIAEACTQDAKKKAFSRARRYLLEHYYIATRDDLYWIQGRDNGPQRAITGQCPGLSPLLNGPDRDISPKGCPVARPGSAENPLIEIEVENAEYI
ncbi:MAG: helicase RepA family protein [Deltaproteobacteria bacterium]|nr:helicase RepA family protein [Deltaproteobacteria bacterium]